MMLFLSLQLFKHFSHHHFCVVRNKIICACCIRGNGRAEKCIALPYTVSISSSIPFFTYLAPFPRSKRWQTREHEMNEWENDEEWTRGKKEKWNVSQLYKHSYFSNSIIHTPTHSMSTIATTVSIFSSFDDIYFMHCTMNRRFTRRWFAISYIIFLFSFVLFSFHNLSISFCHCT